MAKPTRTTKPRKRQEWLDAQHVNVERLGALFYVMQSGTLPLLDLKNFLAPYPIQSRMVARYRAEYILEGLRKASDACQLALDTFEALLDGSTPAAPPIRRCKHSRARSNVIDFAAERTRRGLTTVTAEVES